MLSEAMQTMSGAVNYIEPYTRSSIHEMLCTDCLGRNATRYVFICLVSEFIFKIHDLNCRTLFRDYALGGARRCLLK